MSFWICDLRVHPATRHAKGFGKVPATIHWLVGRPGQFESFPDLHSAIVFHAVAENSTSDLIRVVVDPTAPMKSGRLVKRGSIDRPTGRADYGRINWSAYGE